MNDPLPRWRSAATGSAQAAGAARPWAFTLIELLVVVGIIAILSAIAVVNFLEAQNRAKISRARAELRTLATALEAYRLDENAYPPNDGVYNVIPLMLSTPIAYLSHTDLVDPFKTLDVDPSHGILARYYTYDKTVSKDDFLHDGALGYVAPSEACDFAPYNVGALDKYGKWRLVSYGPDRAYASQALFGATDPVLWGSDVSYDPTNGSTSWGNLLYTQVSTEGKVR